MSDELTSFDDQLVQMLFTDIAFAKCTLVVHVCTCSDVKTNTAIVHVVNHILLLHLTAGVHVRASFAVTDTSAAVDTDTVVAHDDSVVAHVLHRFF